MNGRFLLGIWFMAKVAWLLINGSLCFRLWTLLGAPQFLFDGK